MFEKNLQDLVKGIRSTKTDLNIYISQCMQVIKLELKSTDPFIKAQAIRKLTYLNMLGYDMSWASFYIVEVMSYERFWHKRIGYTAACQSFRQDTEVVLLCTNLLKKEFGSGNPYEVGLAVNALANIATCDLARDLLSDIVVLMQSPHAYIRKKATLVLYKLYLRYPQGLRVTFDQLKKRMEDSNTSVISCAVNVICELANKKPKNYLGLVPIFFQLLTTSSNNWMLIKVVKLLSSLVPEEPRLARKLLEPLAIIIQNTLAKSLLYECITTVTTALLYTKKSDGNQPRNVNAVVRLCNDQLRRYIEDQDQNLRYLGLVGLSNLMQSHPYVVTEHQAVIIECLGVQDITIRMRALELLVGMIHPDNAMHIVKELMRQIKLADGIYRHELVLRILDVCGSNKYANIHDFEWYVGILVQLARIATFYGASQCDSIASDERLIQQTARAGNSANNIDKIRQQTHGVEIARQLVDIAVRVISIRNIIVEHMIDLLLEDDNEDGPAVTTLSQVYFAAAWITGEYIVEYLDDFHSNEDNEEMESDEERETIEEKLERVYTLSKKMLHHNTTALPANVQAVYIQAMLKLAAATSEHGEERNLQDLSELILRRLDIFLQSEHIEVQERAVSLQQIFLSLNLGLNALSLEKRASAIFDHNQHNWDSAKRPAVLSSYFAERLAPVGIKAQRKVPVPETLQLDKPFHEKELSFLLSENDLPYAIDDDLDVAFGQSFSTIPAKEVYASISDESSNSNSEGERKETDKSGSISSRDKDPFYLSTREGTYTESGPNHVLKAFAVTKSRKSSKRHRRAILEKDVMPEGASSSDEELIRRNSKSNDQMSDLAAIDLSIPLQKHEKIPDEHLYHRTAVSRRANDEIKKKKKKKESKQRSTHLTDRISHKSHHHRAKKAKDREETDDQKNSKSNEKNNRKSSKKNAKRENATSSALLQASNTNTEEQLIIF